MDESARITVRIDERDSDAEHINELTLRLRDELLDLDVAVEGVRAGDAPAGARSVDIESIGTLVVTLSQSPVIAAIVTAVSKWLGERRQRTVKLEMDGDILELSGSPSAEQRELVDAWLRRHEPAVTGPGGGRFALIVANDTYQDPGLSRLNAPAQDAAQLAAVLRDPKIGGFDVQTLRNESAAVINEAVEDFFADRDPDELLLLYFSGHGVKDEGGELYFAAAPTKLHRLGATAVAADFVNRRMNRSRSRRIVLLLDCCYSGAFGRGMLARAGDNIAIDEQFGGRGRAVITASSAMEYAFEGIELADNKNAGPSVFTSALIEGLDTGDADRDQDGFIGLDELYDYVYERVQRATPHQTPGKWTFDVQGDLHIARRGRPVTVPTPLPAELQEAIDHPLSGMRAGAVGELGRLLAARHAGLALAARLALERLLDDDSRAVASAAAEALGVPATFAAPITLTAPAKVPPAVKLAASAAAATSTAPPREASRPTAPPAAADPPRATRPSRPSAPADRGPAEPGTPEPPPGPAGWWASGRILAALSAPALAVGYATTLAVGYATTHVGVSSSGLTFLGQSFMVPLWLWLVAGGALFLAVAPGAGRSRYLPAAIVLGLAPGLLTALVDGLGGFYRPAPGSWVPVAGAFVALAAATVAMFGPGGVGDALLRGVCAGIALAGMAIQVLSIGFAHRDAPHVNGLVVLAVVLLAVAGAAVRLLRWRRAGTGRTAMWLGAATAALLLGDGLWAIATRTGIDFFFTGFLPALLVVLVVDVLLDEAVAVPLVVVRLGVIFGLVWQAPLYRPGYLNAMHPVLEMAAAGFALAAFCRVRREGRGPGAGAGGVGTR